MAHAIEAAKSARSACATCGETIAKGEVRVAEEYQDTNLGAFRYQDRGEYGRHRIEGRATIQRFHHLHCAVDAIPSIVKSALNQRHDDELIPDRKGLDAKLAAALEAERLKRVAQATAKLAPPVEAAAADPNLDPLLAQLADDPENPELIAIIGDLYQSRSDPRGELISIQPRLASNQLAARGAKRERGPEVANPRGRTRTAEVEDPTTRTMIARRDELMAQLTPRLDGADRSVWGLGFVRRLELGPKSGERITELAGLWTHPSIRVISELRLALPSILDDSATTDQLAAVLPRSLRKLEIGGSTEHGGALGRLVAALPRLEELWLLERRADPAIAHGLLARLGFQAGAYAESLALLAPDKLPAVRELAIYGWTFANDPLSAIARTPWVRVVDRVRIEPPALVYMAATVQPLPIEAAEALRSGLAGRKLAVLEIQKVPIPLPVRAVLAECCLELVCPSASVVIDEATTHVTHASKPEWGRGKIVKRGGGKLEIKFPKEGVKVFKVDAPFLIPVADEQ